jgi:hypothetical protein
MSGRSRQRRGSARALIIACALLGSLGHGCDCGCFNFPDLFPNRDQGDTLDLIRHDWSLPLDTGAPPSDTDAERDTERPMSSLRLLWRINGSSDSTALGSSFDRCTEVGAATLQITLSTSTTPLQSLSLPCEAVGGAMETVLQVHSGVQVRVSGTLVDAAGQALTTTVDRFIARTEPAGHTVLLHYYYDQFIAKRQGTLRFEPRFGGLPCSALTASVEQLTLIAKPTSVPPTGDPAGLQVCAAAPGDAGVGLCTAADGVTARPCSDEVLTIGPLPWGYYRLLLEGRPATTTPADGGSTAPCWYFEKDVLVGAGNNPSQILDLLKRPSCP